MAQRENSVERAGSESSTLGIYVDVARHWTSTALSTRDPGREGLRG